MTLGGHQLWERHGGWWQEHYTEGADPEYADQILPLAQERLGGARRVLDVGCGEGQVARSLARPGTDVVGVDPTASQIAVAVDRGGAARYVRSRAEQLPFVGASFDAVVLCLAIEHVGPFEQAFEEIARVLAPGGRLLFFLTHPLLQTPGSGWVVDQARSEHYWRVGPYLDDDVAVDTVAPGVQFAFAHRPLSRYVRAMGRAGLLIDDMEEPPPPAVVVDETCGFPDGDRIPRLLVLSARLVP